MCTCVCGFALLARDEVRGKEAVAKLESEGLNPKFHQLDIDDPNSIERLRKFVQDNYGGLDILVNNAAIYYKVRLPLTLRATCEDLRFFRWTLSACARVNIATSAF
jgi:carbonyl reductase 1